MHQWDIVPITVECVTQWMAKQDAHFVIFAITLPTVNCMLFG